MDSIYSRKSNIKLVLLALALIIGSATFFYTTRLVNKISDEERRKVKLWAEAIEKKAELVKFTNSIFIKLGSEERKKVELWAEATRKLANISGNEDFTFPLKVVEDNTTVPVILVNENDKIISSRNLPDSIANNKELLKAEFESMKALNQIIEIEIFKGRKNYLYYKDSQIFTDLRNTMDDLIGSFISEIVVNSTSVPVLFTDSSMQNILASGNINESQISTQEDVDKLVNEMTLENAPIEIDLGSSEKSFVLYQDSLLLNQLKYYPLVQLGAVAFFVLLGYWLFSIVRNAEQNRVWVGWAKETAHQLGTPLSSMMAWMDYMRMNEKFKNETVIDELQKDINRLGTITERFSNIGSVPVLDENNVLNVVTNYVDYLSKRVSKKIVFKIDDKLDVKEAKINVSLFEWVLENISKNAIDAMKGVGTLTYTLSNLESNMIIQIQDTGSGMTKKQLKQVFNPGFTTKKRGWGLGLTLAKRIVEEYHQGKITVNSKVGEGTVFKIVI